MSSVTDSSQDRGARVATALGELINALGEQPGDGIVSEILAKARMVLGQSPGVPGVVDDPNHPAYRASCLFLITPDGKQIRLHATQGFPPEQLGQLIPADYAHPGMVLQSGEPLVLEDTGNDTRFVQILKTRRMGSATYAPVRVGGKVCGVLIVAALTPNTFDAVDLSYLTSFAGLVGLALAK